MEIMLEMIRGTHDIKYLPDLWIENYNSKLKK